MDPNDQNSNPMGDGQAPVADDGAGNAGVPAAGDDASMPSTPPSTDDVGGGTEPEIAPPTPTVPEEGTGGDDSQAV